MILVTRGLKSVTWIAAFEMPASNSQVPMFLNAGMN